MKILVCISHVPDTTSKINFANSDTAFDTNGVQFVINPNDEFGLTRAIWFKEKNGDQVTVVNVGEADTEPTLRKALAIGADEAIRVNTDNQDPFYIASQIAAVVKEGGYDLVLTGKETIDYNGSSIGAMVAELTDTNYISLATKFEFENGKAVISSAGARRPRCAECRARCRAGHAGRSAGSLTLARIALDAMGGDLGPSEIVEAVKLAFAEYPELNPVEKVWQYLRQNWLSNRVFETYDDIVARCCDAWNFFANDTATVRSITTREYAKAVKT